MSWNPAKHRITPNHGSDEQLHTQILVITLRVESETCHFWNEDFS